MPPGANTGSQAAPGSVSTMMAKAARRRGMLLKRLFIVARSVSTYRARQKSISDPDLPTKTKQVERWERREGLSIDNEIEVRFSSTE